MRGTTVSTVNYNLNNAALLGGLAPAALPGGGFGNAALPAGLAGAGIYMIVNDDTNNRYIGISQNLAVRFQPRLEAVTELGFSDARMDEIAVYWGTITTQDTPAAPPVLPGAGAGLGVGAGIGAGAGAPIAGAGAGAGAVAVPPPVVIPPPVLPLAAYNAPLQVLLDGVAVNLERLLIRFVISQLGVGGTVSNNMMAMGNYVNPTANPVTVNFSWGAGGLFVAGAHAAVWPVGGVGW
jgi:hypothetical protein